MNLETYKAVFFDVGGTLLKVYPSVGEVYARHARSFGFEGAGSDLDRKFKSAWKEMGGLESLGKRSGPEVERKFWKDLVRKVFDTCGELSDFDSYFDLIYEVFRKKECWKIYEDVIESGLLERLKSRGVKLGVISNWDSRLESILKNMELTPYFDFVLASAVIGSAKPDEKIFREALDRSMVSAEEACHIGDEFQTDYQGATNLGIDAILIDRHGKQKESHARKVNSFFDLI